MEITSLISKHKSKKDKKKILDYILKSGGIGKYNGERGARIVQNMTDREIENELKTILRSIVSVRKPSKKLQKKVEPKTSDSSTGGGKD